MIHLFVARDIAPASPRIHTRMVSGRLLVYWHMGDSTWVLGGQAGRDRLIELARQVREAVDSLPKRVQLDAEHAAVDPAAARSSLADNAGDPEAIDTSGKRPWLHDRL